MPDATSAYLNKPCRPLSEVQHLRSPEWPRTRSLRIPPKGTRFDLAMEDRRRAEMTRRGRLYITDRQTEPTTPRLVCETRRYLLSRSRATVRDYIASYRKFMDTERRFYSARQQREWEARFEINIADAFAAYKVHRSNLADAVEWAAGLEAKWEDERFTTYERALAGED